MPIHNIEIVEIFNQMADLLEIQGENPFRIRAYRNAARVIGGLSQDVAEMIAEKKELTTLPGIGEDLAGKIKEIVDTGSLSVLKAISKKVPPVLSELLKIESLGPKRVKLLYDKLKIKKLSDLKKAIESGRLKQLPGFGEKTIAKIHSGLLQAETHPVRFKLADAIMIANHLLAYLKKIKGVNQVTIAGSYRRRKETIGDLDIVVTATNPQLVIQQWIRFEEITEILSKGEKKVSVRLKLGIQVDIRIIPNESYGATLLYFTGSKAHNIALRKIAIQKKLKMNEYGLFKGNKVIASKTEKDMYAAIGLPYIEPELREDHGEIEVALKHQLPQLITLNDIRGDLHCHTQATDGKCKLDQLAHQAIQLGYEYLALTDHTKHLTVAHGLDEKQLLNQIKLIDQFNAKQSKIVILKSAEVDILEDGSLDLSNAVLKELDFTVCSIHYKFDLSLEKQTERIIRAMDNPYFTILGHATGRLINQREAYAVDIEKVMRAAKERRCILELNAQPERLDLNEVYCQQAKALGIKIAISTDTHQLSDLNYMPLGVDQARRGWLSAKDVVNTYPLKELKKFFKK